MEILETAVFTKQVRSILKPEEYRQLQNELIINPEVGDLIKNTGGLRKIRVKSGGKGKRGGARAIYYWFCKKSKIIMLLIYAKNAQTDLTPEQKRILRQIMESEEG
jgi:mRNA-degrading endonuclease RelE of RelBE toxin-antitoxin system